MTNTPLRAAILGTGSMGNRHGRSLLSLPDIRLVGLCGRTEENAARLRETLGAAEAGLYRDSDLMLAETRPDLLFVCLPPSAHTGQAERAAALGVSLFLEKPLALTLAQAAAMARAIEQAGVVSQVGYHFRFKKSIRRFLELAAGRPTLFQGRYWCRMDDGPAWWQSAAGSGGQVYEQAIHLYDLALAFCGTPAVVWGQTANLGHRDQPDYTIEDTSVGMARFESGTLCSITSSNCAIPDRFIGDFRLACDGAVLEYRSTGDWRVPDAATLYRDGAEEQITEDGDPYLEEARYFADCVRAGRPTGIGADIGLAGVRFVSAVLHSAAEGGRPVSWGEIAA